MNTTKHLILAVGIFACMYTNAFALQYKDLTIDANSTETRQWLVDAPGGVRPGTGLIKPTYMVRLYVVNKPTALPPVTSVLATQKGMGLSQEQKDLIATGQGISSPSDWNGEPVAPSCWMVYLYAVSKEEAYKVTEAYVEALEREANVQVREAEQRCVNCDRDRSLLQQKIEETQVEIRNIVRNQGTVTSPEDIGRMISTTDELKNSFSIDVAGLNARIEAMTKYIAAKETSPEGKTRLQQMLIDHNIELAGVLAKLKKADEVRQQVEEKYMFSLRLGELRKQGDELRAQLMKAEELSRKAANAYMQAQGEVIHPQIFQNKATIYPVKTEK